MAAVAYTSFKAEAEFHQRERPLKRERNALQRRYALLGVRGKQLQRIVSQMIMSKQRWRSGEKRRRTSPYTSAVIVGTSALFGSLIPILPFFVFSVATALWTSICTSAIILFFVGWSKARITGQHPFRSGFEMALIGMLAALSGYAIGLLLTLAV